jgi:hypothetical protein
MDFLNAMARASWGFIRNQDDRYGVKVVAEEAISLKWQVDEYSYSVPGNFRRLKELGFETREELARFFEFLPALVEVTEYDLDEIATLLNAVEPPLAGPGVHRAERSRTSRGRGWTTCTTTATSRIRCHRSIAIRRDFCLQRCATSAAPEPLAARNYGPKDRFDYLPADRRAHGLSPRCATGPAASRSSRWRIWRASPLTRSTPDAADLGDRGRRLEACAADADRSARTISAVREITWPSRSYLIAIIANLATAWLLVSVATRLIGNPVLRWIVRYGAWTWVTLRILQVDDEARDLLESIALNLGRCACRSGRSCRPPS